MEIFKPKHPLITGDGVLTKLGDLTIDHLSLGDGSERLRVGRALGEITWEPLKLGSDVSRFLEDRGFKFDGTSFRKRLHIRSFLAQSGLHMNGALQDIRHERGSLVAEVELQFLVDQVIGGNPEFPLERGMRHMMKTGPQLEVANLLFIPDEAAPLSEDQIAAAEKAGEMKFHDGYEWNGGLQIPLGPGQYQLGWLKGIDETEWPAFFHDGKRFMVQMRLGKENADAFLAPGLNIRDIRVWAKDDYALYLKRETGGGVIQTASPFLVIDPDRPRIVELLSTRVAVPTETTQLNAAMFRRGFDTKTTFPKPEIGESDGSSKETSDLRVTEPVTLDRALAHSEDIARYLALIDSWGGGLVNGVLIGEKGAHLVPNDPDAKMELWAKRAARRGLPLDERVLDRIAPERRQGLLRHPGALALSQLKGHGVTHHDKFVYVSQYLPSPTSMRELAQYSGVGITEFIATELRDITSADDHHYSAYTIHPRDLSAYRDLVEDGLVKIYWSPPDGGFKKLVGPTFVSVGLDDFYRDLELVIAMYCSGEELAQHAGAFEGQVGKLVGQLDALGKRSAIVTGGSSELSQRVNSLVQRSSNVRSMAFASLHYKEDPDFSPDMLMMVPAGGRRHANQLLANVSNVRIFLNGGIGTSAALHGGLIDTQWAATTPSPIAAIDLQGKDHWGRTRSELEGFASGDFPSAPAWVPGVVNYSANLPAFFHSEIMPYLSNALEWMKAKGIPREIQKAGLAAHLHHGKEFGRNPAAFLLPAMRHFGLTD